MTDQTLNEIDSEQSRHVKGVVEALLFVNEKPVTLDQIKRVLGTPGVAEIKNIIQALSEEYKQRQSGIRIVEIAGGYQMLSSPGYASYIRDFYKTKHKEKLSKPALETLAIVAYKQPVTRTDVELIRGVNSDGVIAHLLSKELIKPVGRKDVPGRPFLYGTTKQFMEYFGLKSLDDLPKLEEFPTLTPAAEMETGESIPAPVEEQRSAGQQDESAAASAGQQLQEVEENNAQQSA
ncbi:MAG: SMC-Scp complex subunit ScpB [Candidatus Omnitrophica bacterium]|nr:SMC-Scp complex subunit ScpB [Candidatus Omnitrophota bacterium]